MGLPAELAGHAPEWRDGAGTLLGLPRAMLGTDLVAHVAAVAAPRPAERVGIVLLLRQMSHGGGSRGWLLLGAFVALPGRVPEPLDGPRASRLDVQVPPKSPEPDPHTYASLVLTSHPGAAWTIFMNRDGGRYESGSPDDSCENRSSSLSGDFPAYPYGDDSWNAVMGCVRSIFAPFDVHVTDVDPKCAAHLEVVVSQHPDFPDVGVAPALCEVDPNVIIFVGPEALDGNVEEICWTTGRMIGYAFGLDNALLCEGA